MQKSSSLNSKSLPLWSSLVYQNIYLKERSESAPELLWKETTLLETYIQREVNWFKNWFVKLTFYIRWSSPRLLVKVHFYIWVESKQNLFDFCTFLYLTFLQMIPPLDFCKAWKRDAHCWNENFAKYLGNIVQYERICYLQIYL